MKLGDVCDVEAGGTPNTKEELYWGGDIPWITPKDLSNFKERYISHGTRFITEEGLKKSSAKILPKNTILMSSRAPIGHVAIANNPIATNQGFKNLVLPDQCVALYMYYWVKKSKKYLNSLGSGTTFLEISGKVVKNIYIPLPPKDEQERIVAKIERLFLEIDGLILETQTALQNANDMFTSALNTAFDPTNKNWQQVKLGDVCDVRDGTHDSPKFYDNGYPLITSKNLVNDKICMEKIKFISQQDYDAINKRSKVNIGDILFAMIGTIGNPVLITEEPNYAIKNVALFRKSENILANFLRYFLKFNTDTFIQEAKGSTQRFVGLTYLRNYIFYLPTKQEQQNTAKHLETVETHTQKLVQLYKNKLDSLHDLKQSILEQAFKGEL